MTPNEFKAGRVALGLSAAQLARILNTDTRTLRRWESEEPGPSARDPNPIAARVLTWLLAGYRPPEWPTEPRGNASDREA